MTGHRALYLLQHNTNKHPPQPCSSTRAKNMFQDELAQRISEHQLKTCKSYQITQKESQQIHGSKGLLKQLKLQYLSQYHHSFNSSELESLKHKARKRTKINMRLETHCEQPNLERKESSLLSKKEVISLLPKIVRNNEDNQLKEIPNLISQGFSGRSAIKDEIVLKGSIDFRVSRVKERFQQYKKEWHKHLKQNYRANNNDWPETKRKSPSRAVEDDGREQGSSIGKSSYWPETLRSQQKRQQAQYKLYKIKTLEGEFMSSKGRSKFLLQTSWIEDKEEEGCRFKPFGDGLQSGGSNLAPR